MSEKKVWGDVTHTINGPVLTSVLRVQSGSYCSIHKHEKRWNHFLVTSGVIEIVLYHLDDMRMASIYNRIRLLPSFSYAVPPGVWHRFEVLESGWVIEGYWNDDKTPADILDIVRIQEGGRF